MSIFILGLIVFFSAHTFTAVFRKQRDTLVEQIGDRRYMGLFSVVSLAGLTLIVMGWPKADTTILYETPLYLRHLTIAVMAIAIILFVASLVPAGRIAAITRHPMLVGIKIWAMAHLLVNGDVRSVILFGAFLAFAVVDRISVKRRDQPIRPAGPVKNDIIAIGVGLAVYALIAMSLHQYIAGVRLF